MIQTLRSHSGVAELGAELPASQTQVGSVMGTPAYMPPEQALGDVDHLDERADVFGLGAILCEILTGKPPYVSDSGTNIFFLAARGKLSDCFARLDNSGVDADLIALAKHCLELEPNDRPQDAGVVAERITKYMASVEARLHAAEVERAAEAARAAEALQTAREHEAATRAERQARRWQLGLAAVLVSMLSIGGIAASWSAVVQANLKQGALLAERNANSARERADRERLRAEREEERAKSAMQRAESEAVRSLNMLADMQTERGLQAGREGQAAVAALWFANAAALTPHDQERQFANHLRAQAWGREAMTPVALLTPQGGNTRRFDFQPGGALALMLTDERLRIWDWRNEVVLRWSEGLDDISDANWSPNGKQIALASGAGEICLVESTSGKVLRRIKNSERADVLVWSSDGTRLIVCGTHVQVWNLSGEPVCESDWPHPKKVYGINFNRAGNRLVSACEDSRARVFEIGKSLGSQPVLDVDHTPSSPSRIATPIFCDNDRKIVTIHNQAPKLWDLESDRVVTPPTALPYSAARSLAVSPGGNWIAVGADWGCFLMNTGGDWIELKHGNHVDTLDFDREGKSLLTTCFDGTARRWLIGDAGRTATTFPISDSLPQLGTFARAAHSPDGLRLAINNGNQVVIWERSPEVLVSAQISWSGTNWYPRLSPDGQLVTCGARHSFPRLWGAQSTSLSVARVVDGRPAGPAIELSGQLLDSCICNDCRTVAAACVNGAVGTVEVFDIVTGTPLFPAIKLPAIPISVSARPGHSQIVVLCKNGTLQRFDSQSGRLQFNIASNGWSGEGAHSQVLHSPDGKTLVTVAPNNWVSVHDAQTGQIRFPAFNPVIEGGPCRMIEFSSDSQIMATAVCGKNMVQTWDVFTGEKLGPGIPHPGDLYGLWSVAVSPDGKRLLTGHKDGRIRIWDRTSGQLVGAPMQNPDEVHEARFTSDGRHIVAAIRNSPVHVWNVATGKLAVPLLHDLFPPGTSSQCVSLYGDRAVVTGDNRFFVLDLSVLAERPAEKLPSLLQRMELAANQRLQLGELVPLDLDEWTSRWEQQVATRQDPESAASMLAQEFDSAADVTSRSVIVARAVRLELLERMQRLRPREPHLIVALALELARRGQDEDAQRLLGQLLIEPRAAVIEKLDDPILMSDLARLMVENAPEAKWIPLETPELKSDSGCSLTRKPDGSILAGPAVTPEGDTYTILARSPLRKLGRFRLETLPDSKLPGQGQGWGSDGNFALSELRVELQKADGPGIPLHFTSTASDHLRRFDSWTSADDGPWSVIDGQHEHRWDVYPRRQDPHWLAIELADPIEIAENDVLQIQLDFRHPVYPEQRLGRFRLSIGDNTGEVRNQQLRAGILNNVLTGVDSLAAAYLVNGDPASALEVLKRAKGDSRRSLVHQLLETAAYQQLNESDVAQKIVQDLLVEATPNPLPQLLIGFFRGVVADVGKLTPAELNKLSIKLELRRQSEIVQSNPTAANYLQHADYLLRLGRWQESAESRLRGLREPLLTTDVLSWHTLVLTRLMAGDRDGYRKLCQEAARESGGTQQWLQADILSKACLYLPDTVETSKLPLKIVKQNADTTTNGLLRSWFLTCLALAAYRDGQFAESIDLIKTMSNWSGESGIVALIIRAMAEEQLGQHERAIRSLLLAEQSLPAELATLGSPDYAGPMPVPATSIYPNYLAADILRREAALQIHNDPARTTPHINREKYRNKLEAFGKWAEAAQIAADELELNPRDRGYFFRAALLDLLAGNPEGYRKTCRDWLGQFDSQLDVDFYDSLCKTCLLLPDTVDRSKLPVSRLLLAIDDPQSARGRDYYIATCAFSAYRDSQPQMAIDLIQRTKNLTGHAGSFLMLVRAMAEEKLGQHDRAMRTLTDVEAMIPAALATVGTVNDSGATTVPFAILHSDWLYAELVRREAALLIRKDSARLTE